MTIQTPEAMASKRTELKNERDMFIKFLNDVYKDEDAKEKIELHLWRINRELSILDWMLDDDLPF